VKHDTGLSDLALGSGRGIALPRHPDQHRPERPILLAVDQRTATIRSPARPCGAGGMRWPFYAGAVEREPESAYRGETRLLPRKLRYGARALGRPAAVVLGD
jgi:hypothetical protein